MVGLIEDTRRIVTQGFKNEGDIIALLGETRDDLAASEFAQTIAGLSTDELIANSIMPNVDLEKEDQLHEILLKLAEAGLLSSAHDCSDGGLAVTIAESCFSSLGRKSLGANIELGSNGLSNEALLFGETPSRVVISFAASDLDRIKEIIGSHLFSIIGTVSDDILSISVAGQTVISSPVAELESIWQGSLAEKLT